MLIFAIRLRAPAVFKSGAAESAHLTRHTCPVAATHITGRSAARALLRFAALYVRFWLSSTSVAYERDYRNWSFLTRVLMSSARHGLVTAQPIFDKQVAHGVQGLSDRWGC